MVKYHVNNDGNVGLCRAKKQCPFGGEQDHFKTAAGARHHYEQLSKPVHVMAASAAQLAAFRRHGDFHEQDGDVDLLNRLEREEDRQAGTPAVRFSRLDAKRIEAIAEEKIAWFGDGPLDRYHRGVKTRIESVAKAAREMQAR